ncbi:Protein EXECUTER 1, chloroplastic [Heracleum sosnowskyi]|uniref:Protein EXECUTER 1, chloroplastic n=1 Tax=Heracleum sosnowskyi TaxID=360622 RepID=A0AAD8JFD5_9APIA|nr:Protein EXECUTER 1, chloroplastic [Heracleum sosnowskyi]
MYLLRRQLCSSLKTASFHLHSPPATFISSCRNPRSFILRNPNCLNCLPTASFSYSSVSTSPITDDTKSEAKKSVMSDDEWKQWLKHFDENDQQARLVSDLKSQYTCAVDKEDYENAVRLQVAITSATQSDAVGRVMSDLDKAIEEERYEDATFLRDHTGAGLVGWWAGVSQDHKDPYGQIIHISPVHGKFVAKSYSPWQLATTKDGTPLFEIYVSNSKEDTYKEQAIYLKHEAVPEESRGVPDKMYLDLRLTHLTPYASRDLWAETLRKFAVASGKDATKQTFIDIFEKCRVKGKPEGYEGNNEGYVFTKVPKFFGEDKTVIRHEFAVGSFVEKSKGTLENDFLRVPAMLDRKDYFSFSLAVDENKDHLVSNDDSFENYRTWDHNILDHVNCIGRGVVDRKKEYCDKERLFTLSQAENQQPLLSGLTTFSRIIVPASSDPLNGLYVGSNGYLVTEVIQIRRQFGHWPGDDGIGDHSKLEPCNYVEVVKLTGDPDVPAGQVSFRAKVGEKYKLPLWSVLEKDYGAVARYKGEGRLSGFQESKWVDVELFILGEEHRKEGFAIGFLFPAQDYYFMKLFKQLKLQSIEGSH